jgi:hypothetical protein
MQIELTKQDRAAMAETDALLLAEQQAEGQKSCAVLAEVECVVSAEVYAAILAELMENSHTFDYKIAMAPIGREQDDDAPWGKHFVHQTTNGGYTGDDYAGTVSIPLGDGRFFQFGYAM